MGRNVRNIQWSVSKKGEWYTACFNPPLVDEFPQLFINEFKNHKALFTRKFNWLNFIDEFKKTNIKFEILPHLDNSDDAALVDIQDIDFLLDRHTYWDYCFFIVPESIINSKTLKLPNKDFEYEITNSDLEKFNCPLLYYYYDLGETTITTKNKKVIDEHLISLFRWMSENTKLNNLEMFTDDIMCNLMNHEEGSFEISSKSFEQHDDDSVSFQLWHSCHNPVITQVRTIILKEKNITYSDWEEQTQRELPSNIENGKGIISYLTGVILIIVGIYYLIGLF